MLSIEIILIIVLVYLALGVLFLIPFLVKGISKVDGGAHGSTIGFKIIIIPGVIVFWPALLKKWMKVNATEARRIYSVSLRISVAKIFQRKGTETRNLRNTQGIFWIFCVLLSLWLLLPELIIQTDTLPQH